jgi:hypothetical protein
MDLYRFTRAALNDLKKDLDPERYRSAKPWVIEHFGTTQWRTPVAGPGIPDALLLKMPTGPRQVFDAENAEVVYTALQHLHPAQVDEGLCAYLSHVTFWDYMRERWPVEGGKNNKDRGEFVITRYFFQGHDTFRRATIRNGIGRLWWYGYLTHDPERADPFELTKLLFYNQDVALQVSDRFLNRSLLRSILTAFLKLEPSLGDKMMVRKTFRKLAKHLNREGGSTILDALSIDELVNLVEEIMDLNDEESLAAAEDREEYGGPA